MNTWTRRAARDRAARAPIHSRLQSRSRTRRGSTAGSRSASPTAGPGADPAPHLSGRGHADVRERPRHDRRGDAPALAVAPCAAAVQVSGTGTPASRSPAALTNAFLCIHHYEGAWDVEHRQRLLRRPADGPGFQGLYGADFIARWGTADHWPAWAQLQVAVRAYRAGRGFYPVAEHGPGLRLI